MQVQDKLEIKPKNGNSTKPLLGAVLLINLNKNGKCFKFQMEKGS